MLPRIRPAGPEDAKEIARIHASSWRSSYRGLLPQRYLDAMSAFTMTVRWQKRLRWDDSRPDRLERDVWVIERADQVVGFSLIEPCVDDSPLTGFAGEVSMLYISPEWIGQGFGRVLLDHALAELSKREYYWVVIWVLKENHKARRFYERAGLRPDGASRQDRFVNQRVSVIRYAKALNPVVDFNALVAGEVVESS